MPAKAVDSLNERWSCPHSTDDDYPLCLYHRRPSEKTHREVTARFREDVSRGGSARVRRRSKEFLGATLPGLTVTDEVLDGPDTFPIRLDGSTVQTDIDLSRTNVRQPLHIEDATVAGSVILEDTALEKNLTLNWTTICGDLRAKWCQFSEHVGLYDSEIEGHVELNRARFGMTATCQSVTVHGRFDCEGATFESGIAGGEAEFGERAYFSGIVSNGDVELVDASFERGVAFYGSIINGRLILRGAHVESTEALAIDCRQGEFKQLDLGLATSESITVSLREAVVKGGKLYRSGQVEIDLFKTTLGPVDLDESGFGWYKISETTFDRFDFDDRSIVRALVDSKWRVALESHDEATPDSLETTYLKMKNGADSVGANRVAAELFRRQLVWRRRGYLQRAVKSPKGVDTFRLSGAWIANFALSASTGYGERPYRVIGLSVAVILGFALLFESFWTGKPPYGSDMGYLLVSIESFVTLVLGGAAEVRQPLWIRLLAEVEGFIGVFLIALFVFTLTRSVHR